MLHIKTKAAELTTVLSENSDHVRVCDLIEWLLRHCYHLDGHQFIREKVFASSEGTSEIDDSNP